MGKELIKTKIGFEESDPDSLARERSRHEDILVYLRRFTGKTFNKLKENHFCLAMFSSTGDLLEMYPRDEKIRADLMGDNIKVGDNWANTGFNAVTEGFRARRSRASIGEENELPCLKNYAIYFSIMDMLEVYSPYQSALTCGIAIIAPLRYAWDDYFTMVMGISHDIMLNVQFRNVSIMYYERSGKGLLVVDTMIKGKTPVVTFANDVLFRVLGISPTPLKGASVEEIILPLPENPRFWSIIEKNEKIREEYIVLKLRGQEVECIISTDAYHQPSIQSSGVIFYFTNDRKKSESVSQKMANGAVKTFDDVIGEDPKFRRVLERAKKMALTDSNIMILGESGTGKDVLAQAIHNASRRSSKPFVAINCGAIPKDLIESELFGYEAGTFTGAKKNGNMGKFELAMGGTIFLDEIGEMPLDLQVKLLRVVEQKQFMRLGGTHLIDVDVRIISATNVDVQKMIQQNRFREDLYYRLSTMKLSLMPLRERQGDIVPLAQYFVRKVSERVGRSDIMQITPDAKRLLTRMKWGGNIRELQNLIECIVQLYPDERITEQLILDNATISADLLSETPSPVEKDRGAEIPVEDAVPQGDHRKEENEETVVRKSREERALTREDFLDAIDRFAGNKTKAAKYLGIPRRTFYRRLEEFGI